METEIYGEFNKTVKVSVSILWILAFQLILAS